MKTRKIFALLVIAGICIFSSCKDDDVSPLTAEEAQMEIASADNEFVSLKGEVFESPGMIAQETVYDLGLPFSVPMKSSAKLNLKEMEPVKDVSQFTKSKGGYGPDYLYFPFTEYVGTWEKVEEVWTKILTTPTDKIVIKFSFNGGTNNGTLTYSDYQTKPVPYAVKDDGTYISQLKSKIEIDGQTNPVMTWVYTATRTITGGTIKKVITYGNIFTLTEQQSMNSNLSGTVTASYLFEVKKNGEVLYSKSFETTLEGMLKTKADNFSVNVTARVKILNLLINYKIIITQDTDTSDPSNFMTVTLKLTSGAKVADVVFEGEENEPYFKFTDGTKVKIMDILSEDLLSELEEFMDSIMSFFS